MVSVFLRSGEKKKAEASLREKRNLMRAVDSSEDQKILGVLRFFRWMLFSWYVVGFGNLRSR
jgi:hypothetical protein